MKLYISFFPASRSVHEQGIGGVCFSSSTVGLALACHGSVSTENDLSSDLNFLFSPVRSFLALKTSSCYLRVKAAVIQGVPTASFSSMAPGRRKGEGCAFPSDLPSVLWTPRENFASQAGTWLDGCSGEISLRNSMIAFRTPRKSSK